MKFMGLWRSGSSETRRTGKRLEENVRFAMQASETEGSLKCRPKGGSSYRAAAITADTDIPIGGSPYPPWPKFCWSGKN